MATSAKRLDSIYRPGERSPDWIKTPLRRRSEFVIGGWIPGSGPNRHTVAAVLVGAHDAEGLLKFCGVVGAGMTAPHRRVLTEQLAAAASDRSPFFDAVPQARWVSPVLIGDVEYRELRRTLRHASWKGLRADLADVSAVLLPVS